MVSRLPMARPVELVDLITVAIIGVVSHVTYFCWGEHHLHVVLYVRILFAAVAAMLVVFAYGQGIEMLTALSKTFWLAGSYLTGLYFSLVTYRLLFHSLNRFPGPIGSRISDLWTSAQLSNRDAFKHFRKLHDRHGPFVRVGPSSLSIAHPKCVYAIYGQGSKCTKAAWYDLTKPMTSLQTLREKSLHDRRRRVWSAAFSDRALRGYEKRIQIYRRKLVAHIASLQGQPINVTKLFNLFSFDVMGDLAFGESFDMLETSQVHWAIKLLKDGMEPLAFMLPVWLFRLLTSIPGLARDWWRFIGFCVQRMEQRMKARPEVPDIASALLAPLEGQRLTGKDLNLLHGDAQLIVVAGSDTTGTTLASAIFELARHPQHVEKLRAELAPYAINNPSGEVLNQDVASLDHLNGIINETLRLHPPVPTALQRKTPPEGITIGGTYIPGNTTVWSPQYVLGKDESIYPSPESFVPERWYLYPSMIKEKSAFAPFSTGPHGCIGRPLALLNLRTTITQLVMKFDFGFAPGEDGTNFDANAKEHFTISKGQLDVVFTERT